MLYGPHLFQDKTVFERKQEMLEKKRKSKHKETPPTPSRGLTIIRVKFKRKA